VRLDFSFVNEEQLAESSLVKDIKVEFMFADHKVGQAN
jgi:hypothetical protein